MPPCPSPPYSQLETDLLSMRGEPRRNVNAEKWHMSGGAPGCASRWRRGSPVSSVPCISFDKLDPTCRINGGSVRSRPAKSQVMALKSAMSRWDYLISQGPELGWWWTQWTLDLQWESPIWYEVSLKCWLTLLLPPFPFHDNLPFWNISNVRDQTGLLLELGLLQEGSTVVMFNRTNMDPRGQIASSAPGSRSRNLLTTLPTCVCIGVWYQRKSNANALGRKPGVDQEKVWNYGRLKISSFGWVSNMVSCLL